MNIVHICICTKLKCFKNSIYSHFIFYLFKFQNMILGITFTFSYTNLDKHGVKSEKEKRKMWS